MDDLTTILNAVTSNLKIKGLRYRPGIGRPDIMQATRCPDGTFALQGHGITDADVIAMARAELESCPNMPEVTDDYLQQHVLTALRQSLKLVLPDTPVANNPVC